MHKRGRGAGGRRGVPPAQRRGARRRGALPSGGDGERGGDLPYSPGGGAGGVVVMCSCKNPASLASLLISTSVLLLESIFCWSHLLLEVNQDQYGFFRARFGSGFACCPSPGHVSLHASRWVTAWPPVKYSSVVAATGVAERIKQHKSSPGQLARIIRRGIDWRAQTTRTLDPRATRRTLDASQQ